MAERRLRDGRVRLAEMPPEPDYEAVIRKEFQLSLREGREGLLRFIARHPDHPLADRARDLLDGRSGDKALQQD